MPREIKDKEEFLRLLPEASEVRVVKAGDEVKLKLRTPEVLYTFKTKEEEVEALTKGTKAPIVEF